MNHEANISVDSLSYKELQGLAMSMSLPGKMKQGVLVEAIKARQNHNEVGVAMILEANRQRRILERQQQQKHQKKQLTKIQDALNSKRGSVPRTKIKRSASEMDHEQPFIDEESFKRSKLAAALIQQRRPSFFNSFTTAVSAALTIRKEQQQYQSAQTNGGCSTWDPHAILESSGHLLPQSVPCNFQKPLPDLSKDLSILPSLSDCSSNSATPSTGEDLGCCSVGSVSSGPSSSWSNMSANAEQPLPQSSFESCDSGWIGTDESYDLNTWRNMPHNSKLSNSYESSSNNSSGFFEDHSNSDAFTNGEDVYRPDDFIAGPSNMNGASNYNDYHPPTSFDSSYPELNIKPDPWCEPVAQPQTRDPQATQQSNSQSQSCYLDSRVIGDCCYDLDCYQPGGPHFRIQRPGNPTPIFVPSGRSRTLSTFCNMLPRVASYVQ